MERGVAEEVGFGGREGSEVGVMEGASLGVWEAMMVCVGVWVMNVTGGLAQLLMISKIRIKKDG